MKSPTSIYFQRYAYPDLDHAPMNKDMDMIIVIPCYKEPDILTCLRSIHNCSSTLKFCVLVVINDREHDSTETRAMSQKTLDDIHANSEGFNFPIFTRHVTLPTKKAGVGLARKIGMDQAALWFHQLDKNGIIVCYDADCECDHNYLVEIDQFYKNPKHKVGIVSYAHPLETSEIIQYESHLRYHIDAQHCAGYPYAFQTLGSCITLRSETYCKYGGMNTRKAGEDFYFLHKLALSEKIGRITQARVIPSSRVSDRVPFGTGRAIGSSTSESELTTYNPDIYACLQQWIPHLPAYFKNDIQAPSPIQEFLTREAFDETVLSLRKKSNTATTFTKHIHAWLDGFQLMKLTHYLRDQFYPNVPVSLALGWLNDKLWNIQGFDELDPRGKLQAIRTYEHQLDVKRTQ
ncbi:MAG: glycosyltransferase family 2 protein [Cyclobacteriaceae bacterium]